jgi:diketogulonate reductase-like aldo/keto reductase
MGFNYHTESFVIDAIIQSGIPREEIFLTNKSGIPPSIDELKLRLTRIEYYELFLLHHPPFASSHEFKVKLLEIWTQMNNLLQAGLVKFIGVSNFYDRQLKILLDICKEYNLIKPAVNQIELNPYNQNWELTSFCELNGIRVEAHSPLGGLAAPYLLQNEIIKDIGSEIGATPFQVILANTMKRGITVLPRSLNKNRMIENFLSIDFISKITNKRLEVLYTNFPMISLANRSFIANDQL